MTAAFLAVLLVAFGTSARAESSGKRAAPAYSAASIVHSATNRTGPFAPNTLVTIYGTDLAYSEEAAPAGKALPKQLGRAGVLANGQPAPMHYVSPKQINFLIPGSFVEGPLEIRVEREGTAGPPVTLKLDSAAPGLYQRDSETVVATHADYSLVSPEQPARPGEIVVLYGAGLGHTVIALDDGQVAPASPLEGLVIRQSKDFRVLLNGQALDSAAVLYAGLTPGSVGLYQINVRLPENAPANPEIRIAIGDAASPEGLRLPLTVQLSSPAARLNSR